MRMRVISDLVLLYCTSVKQNLAIFANVYPMGSEPSKLTVTDTFHQAYHATNVVPELSMEH